MTIRRGAARSADWLGWLVASAAVHLKRSLRKSQAAATQSVVLAAPMSEAVFRVSACGQGTRRSSAAGAPERCTRLISRRRATGGGKDDAAARRRGGLSRRVNNNTKSSQTSEAAPCLLDCQCGHAVFLSVNYGRPKTRISKAQVPIHERKTERDGIHDGERKTKRGWLLGRPSLCAICERARQRGCSVKARD